MIYFDLLIITPLCLYFLFVHSKLYGYDWAAQLILIEINHTYKRNKSKEIKMNRKSELRNQEKKT